MSFEAYVLPRITIVPKLALLFYSPDKVCWPIQDKNRSYNNVKPNMRLKRIGLIDLVIELPVGITLSWISLLIGHDNVEHKIPW